MPFNVPTFNMMVNIWRNAAPPPALPAVVSQANLAFGRRVSSSQGIQDPAGEPYMKLLLPPHTDVQSSKCGAGNDYIEAPAGTGRYYIVIGVDDIGKGFSNEHRAVVMVATTALGAWPTPIP